MSFRSQDTLTAFGRHDQGVPGAGGYWGVGNICGQVAKRVRLSTSVSGGAMVVVMATLGALAPSQPPDLQGVQIDARRRNNRRIGPRIGRRRFDGGSRRTGRPVAVHVGHSSSPFVLRECLSYSFYFYHRIVSTQRESPLRGPCIMTK